MRLLLSFVLGSLVVSPRAAIMLGGDNLFIAGPCYQPSDVIVCEFAGGKRSNGSYISNIRASCTVPILYITGRLSFKMSVNESNFPNLFKLDYRILSSCFDCIPLSFECTDIKA